MSKPLNPSGLGRYALTFCVTSAVLAGCGGSQPPIGVPGPMPQAYLAQSTTKYDASAPLLFVTNTTDNEVAVYDAAAKNPDPIAVITDGLEFPFGDCIDSDGTLYVTNAGFNEEGYVSEYAAGKTKVTRVITKGIYLPAYCAIDGAGDVWVTNLGPDIGITGDVTEYEKGSRKPSRTITDGVPDPHGIAFDHSGNMYVSNYLGDYDGNVVVYARGRRSPSRTITNGLGSAAGIAVDAKGTLYVADSTQCNVEEYQAGRAQPFQEITDDIDGPQGLNVGKNGWLYVTNTGWQGCKYNGPAAVILEFAPGSLKPSRKEVSDEVHTPGGSAYNPPLLP